MKVGSLICLWGHTGKIVRKMTLNHIVAAEGEEASVWGDKPYFQVQREDGSMFFAQEKYCQESK